MTISTRWCRWCGGEVYKGLVEQSLAMLCTWQCLGEVVFVELMPIEQAHVELAVALIAKGSEL